MARPTIIVFESRIETQPHVQKSEEIECVSMRNQKTRISHSKRYGLNGTHENLT
jgi:hypothetical protein